MTNEDPRQVLEIEAEAGDEEIRAAYLRKVKEYPPDRAPREFERVRDAYEMLARSAPPHAPHAALGRSEAAAGFLAGRPEARTAIHRSRALAGRVCGRRSPDGSRARFCTASKRGWMPPWPKKIRRGASRRRTSGRGDRRRRNPLDWYTMWAAMTALTQEVKLQGRAFKQLSETLGARYRSAAAARNRSTRCWKCASACCAAWKPPAPAKECSRSFGTASFAGAGARCSMRSTWCARWKRVTA